MDEFREGGNTPFVIAPKKIAQQKNSAPKKIAGQKNSDKILLDIVKNLCYYDNQRKGFLIFLRTFCVEKFLPFILLGSTPFSDYLERDMINKPINFRPICDAENEDIRRIHQFYKMLKMHRNPELLTEEMLYSLNILNPANHEKIIKGIKLTPWRALVIAKERSNAEQ